MPFDIIGARKAGYTDEEIKVELSKDFDVDGALNAGYSLDEIAGEYKSSSKKSHGATRDFSPDSKTALFPRMTKAENKNSGTIKTALAGLLDIGSLPGRGISALVPQLTGKETTPEQFRTNLSRTGKEPGTGIVDQIVRAPENVVMGPVGRGVLAGVSKVIPALAKTGKGLMVARMGVEGTGSGLGADAIQKIDRATSDGFGDAKSEIAASGLNVGLGGATGAALPLVGSGLRAVAGGVGAGFKKAGEKIIGSVNRPGKIGYKEGWKAENLFKYKDPETGKQLAGSIDEQKERVQSALADLHSQAKAIGEASSQDGRVVNLSGVLDAVEDKLLNMKGKNVYDRPAMLQQFDDIKNVWKDEYGADEIDLADAMLLKTETGKQGAWQQAADKMRTDPKASAREKVYNLVYTELKNQINHNASGDLASINKQFEDLIPVQKNIERRQIIANTKQIINPFEGVVGGVGAIGSGVSATMSGDDNKAGNLTKGLLGTAAVMGALRAGRSPAVARMFWNAGDRLGSKVLGYDGIEKLSKNIAGQEKVLNTNLAADATKSGKPAYRNTLTGKNENIPESGFEGMNVLTPREYRGLSGMEKLNATPENAFINEYSRLSDDKLMTPEDYYMKKADEAGYSADAPYSETISSSPKTVQFINRIKDDLNIKHDSEVKMQDLSAKKQIQINKMAEAINSQQDLWNEYYRAGLLDRPYDESWVNGVNEARVHPDDIIDWMNSATTRKTGAKLGGTGPFSMLGNQRGEIGGVNPQVKSDNFKKWFGDWEKTPESASKVVDESGKPLVVYHGGPKDINVFDYNKIGTNGIAEGAGFYFTKDKNIASGYGSNGEVYEAYLNIKNPLPYDRKPFTKSQMRGIINSIISEEKKQGTSIRDGFLSNYGDVEYEGTSKVLNEAIESFMGDETALDQISSFVGSGIPPEIVNKAVYNATKYDGVVSKGFGNQGTDEKTIYTAFFPNQIKSATKNNGRFNPSNPDIRGSSALPMLGGMSGGAVAGSTAGAQIGDTPEERRRNAMIGAGLGMLGGVGAAGALSRRGLGGISAKKLGSSIGNQRGEIGAYHGSPYLFDNFEAGDRIGTGEGAQSFGHGLYFTNEKNIAKHYAEKLTEEPSLLINGEVLPIKSDGEKVAYSLLNTYGNIDSAKKEALKDIDWAPHKEAVEILNKNPKIVQGNLYSVTLHKGKTPEQYDYLKWDEYINESQRNKILKELSQSNISNRNISKSDIVQSSKDEPVESFYSLLSNALGGQKEASDFLLRSGIDGIDYPAGSINTWGNITGLNKISNNKNSRNYVVFDPQQISIESVERGSSALPMLGLTAGTGLGALTAMEAAKRKQSQKQRSK